MPLRFYFRSFSERHLSDSPEKSGARATKAGYGVRGFLTAGLVITILALSALGTSLVYITTSSTYGELFANRQERAYFAAESGGRYAVPRIILNPAAAIASLHGQTYTLSSGETFTFSIDNTGATYTLVESIGAVNEGTWFEGRQRITYRINKSFEEPFDDLDNWYDPDGEAKIKSGGPADNDPAVNLKGKESILFFAWQGNPDVPDLAAHWSSSGGLLGYEIQVKIKVDDQGSKGDHYILGISFRLADEDNYYGISFFRSDPDDSNPPDWVDSLPSSFQSLRDENVYAVLWRIESGNITLMDYEQMEASDGVLDSPGELKDWSTIVLKMEELFSGIAGARQNHISGFVQGTSVYPRNTASAPHPISWDYSTFNPIQWDSGTQPIVDETFTSENFDVNLPYEIGLHWFYDSNASNDQYFDDFALRLTGDDDGGVIQY